MTETQTAVLALALLSSMPTHRESDFTFYLVDCLGKPRPLEWQLWHIDNLFRELPLGERKDIMALLNCLEGDEAPFLKSLATHVPPQASQ